MQLADNQIWLRFIPRRSGDGKSDFAHSLSEDSETKVGCLIKAMPLYHKSMLQRSICPLTKQIIACPVTKDCNSYEYEAIAEWLATHDHLPYVQPDGVITSPEPVQYGDSDSDSDIGFGLFSDDYVSTLPTRPTRTKATINQLKWYGHTIESVRILIKLYPFLKKFKHKPTITLEPTFQEDLEYIMSSYRYDRLYKYTSFTNKDFWKIATKPLPWHRVPKLGKRIRLHVLGHLSESTFDLDHKSINHLDYGFVRFLLKNRIKVANRYGSNLLHILAGYVVIYAADANPVFCWNEMRDVRYRLRLIKYCLRNFQLHTETDRDGKLPFERFIDGEWYADNEVFKSVTLLFYAKSKDLIGSKQLDIDPTIKAIIESA